MKNKTQKKAKTKSDKAFERLLMITQLNYWKLSVQKSFQPVIKFKHLHQRFTMF